MAHWESLQNPAIQKFIHEHERDDVRALALKKSPDASWDYPLILDQIRARQKAAAKMPEWLKVPGVILPPADVIEQASSYATAHYKAQIAGSGKNFVDLTAGSGLDGLEIGQGFSKVFLNDMDENAANLLNHNMKLLAPDLAVSISNSDAEALYRDMDSVDLIYLDPQRRDAGRKGKFMLETCSPDIVSILKSRADYPFKRLLLKTSPMLDIVQACRELEMVAGVYVLGYKGECREVLYMLEPEASCELTDIPVRVVELGEGGEALCSMVFTFAQEEMCHVDYSLPLTYLYEPHPAFLKAGGYKMLAANYVLKKLHPHTHLYTSEELCSDFPGRCFKIMSVAAPRSKNLGFKKANLALRNFPGSVDSLRKSLKLSEGGSDYIFAATLIDESKKLIICSKI